MTSLTNLPYCQCGVLALPSLSENKSWASSGISGELLGGVLLSPATLQQKCRQRHQEQSQEALAESRDRSSPTKDLQVVGSAGGVVGQGTCLESLAGQSLGEQRCLRFVALLGHKWAVEGS